MPLAVVQRLDLHRLFVLWPLVHSLYNAKLVMRVVVRFWLPSVLWRSVKFRHPVGPPVAKVVADVAGDTVHSCLLSLVAYATSLLLVATGQFGPFATA